MEEGEEAPEEDLTHTMPHPKKTEEEVVTEGEDTEEEEANEEAKT